MRRVALFAAAMLCAANASAEPPKALYRLSSPDVGQPWHLHAKDGALVCELPCEAWVGAQSGDYLVVHDDPKKVWRVDLPSREPNGAHVAMTARVGRGSPALGALGDVLAFGGAAAAVAGLALLVISFGEIAANLDANVVPNVAVGGPLLAAGAIFASVGLYLRDHNKAAASHVVVTPTSLTARF